MIKSSVTIFIVIAGLCSAKAQSMKELISGTWAVHDAYCNNLLSSKPEDSSCPTSKDELIGSKYIIEFRSMDNTGSLKRDGTNFALSLISIHGKPVLRIDRKLFHDDWYVLSVSSAEMRVIFFHGFVNLETNAYELNGDFHVWTFRK